MKSAHPVIRCFVVPEKALPTRIGRDIPRMRIEDHDPLDRLQEAARRYRNTRTWPRVQAVILAKQGDTAPQIARALGVSRRAVQAWIAAYNRGGLGGVPRPPPPRPHADPAAGPGGRLPGADRRPAAPRGRDPGVARRRHPP